MARGRGSASARQAIAMAFVVACCCWILTDAATTYYVGDGSGWSFSSATWPNGKQFRAGDVLVSAAVFRYIPWVHNVVAVDEDGYNGCTTPPGLRTYTSGSDSVRLARGNNYFICTRFGHCNNYFICIRFGHGCWVRERRPGWVRKPAAVLACCPADWNEPTEMLIGTNEQTRGRKKTN